MIEFRNLIDAPLMASAGELRREKTRHRFDDLMLAQHARAHRQHVGVVVFAAHARGHRVVRDGRANAADFIRGDGHADARAADENAQIVAALAARSARP